MTKKTAKAPDATPEGVQSIYPAERQTPAPIVDALARFDEEVRKAHAQPSRVMQALKLAELVEQQLPEEARLAYTQLRYEHLPRSEGGMGQQVDARRNPHALNALVELRKVAEHALRQKRHAIEVG